MPHRRVTAQITVKVIPQREGGFDTIAHRIANFPEVTSLYLMSGDASTCCSSSRARISRPGRLLRQRKPRHHPRRHSGTATHFMLKTYKSNGVLMESRIPMSGSKSPRNPIVSHVVRDIPRSGIRDFFDIVSTMKDVISLGIGEPDFDTPWHIREAAIHSLEQGITNYTSNLGLLSLRKALSGYVDRTFGVDYDPARNPDRGRRQRGPRPRPARHPRPRRRGGLSRALLRLLPRRSSPSPTACRCRWKPTRRDNFRLTAEAHRRQDHAAHQGCSSSIFPTIPPAPPCPGGRGKDRRLRHPATT